AGAGGAPRAAARRAVARGGGGSCGDGRGARPLDARGRGGGAAPAVHEAGAIPVRILHLLSSPVWSGPAEPVALLAEGHPALGHALWVAIDSPRPGTGSEEAAAPRLEALGLLDSRGLRL